MKSFDKLIVSTAAILAVLCIAVNAVVFRQGSRDYELHNVEINRAEQVILSGNEPDILSFETITSISVSDGSERFYNAPGNYAVKSINGRLYRFDYREKQSDNRPSVLKTELCLGGIVLLYLAVMLYIRQRVIKPFERFSGLPEELARGNLAVPVKEHKSRYFGKFTWGIDMLREKLEQSRSREYEHIRNEKTRLLSLSHDIKTPLSAIKLYANAISKGIYSTPEKQRSAAESISEKADEIEGYVSEIISSSAENMLPIRVESGDFYLSEVIGRITKYYTDKLSALSAELVTEKYTDCMLKGDPDRLEEVLQNILENAVKYGDGRNISISFADEEDCRLVTVSNSGNTLPAEEMNHIFNSFWRGSNSGGKPGNGLGLYICRRLMTAMDGDIFAEADGDIMRVTAVCRKS